MQHPLIAARVYNTPLLLHPRKAAAFRAGFRERPLGDRVPMAFADDSEPPEPVAARGTMIGGAFADELRGSEHGYKIVGGVALIPISGFLVGRGAWIGESLGQTSYEGLRAQLDAASLDTRVRAVALEHDSFGGEAAGVFDLADRIRALRAAKPVRSFINHHAYSGAYALASQADHIVISRTGGAGSIGVIKMHVDCSGALEEAGVAVTLIHAGAHKADGQPYAALPDAVRAEFQSEAESLRQLFAKTVGAGRGALLSAEAALATEARCFTGSEAIKAGLADTVSDPVTAFSAWIDTLGQGGAGAAFLSAIKGASAMGKPIGSENPTAATEDDKPKGEDIPVGEATDDDAEASDRDEQYQAGATAMQARVSAILSAPEAQGRDEQARYIAFKTSLSVEEAKAMLATAPTAGAAGPGNLSARMAARPAATAPQASGGPQKPSSLADRARARFAS